MVVRFLRENQGAAPWMVPILIGMGVMFIGNIVSILPGNIFHGTPCPPLSTR